MATRKMTCAEFVEKSIKKHGDLYDYSQVVFVWVDRLTKVEIRCNACGNVFEQTPASHLQGRGCPVCNKKKGYEKRRLSFDEFKAKAGAVHGDLYDYSRVAWVDCKTKVKIKCNRCGNVFEQTPANHLRGQGCPKCNKKKAYGARCLTTDEFMKRARAVHGDLYDYSRIVYVNSRTDVTISCNTCGAIFVQRPSNHLHGNGCPVCACNRRKADMILPVDEFLRRAHAIHGDKYDYSRMDYKSARDVVLLKCNACGHVFQQVAQEHLGGAGCPNCSHLRRRLTQDEFIQRCKAVHGDKYDYSETVYTGFNRNVKIRCNTCGHVFEQWAGTHMRGAGCTFCLAEANRKKYRSTTDEFIEKAKRVHGDKYDYSLVEYKTNADKVVIICNTCGNVFEQAAGSHLNGRGCAVCANISNGDRKRLTFDDFVRKSKVVHGDSYDYSEVVYLGGHDKVKIKCNTCGHVFWQEANSHMRGSGCPCCGIRKMWDKRVASGKPMSKAEDKMYDRLCTIFGKSDVERQYDKDERYPYHCDFYIKSRDMFIELNAFFAHGDHWFDIDNDYDVLTADVLFDKLDVSSLYGACLYTWMYSDVEKRGMSRRNNLNYVVFWDTNLKDFESWVDAGCPDSHDWEREYAWRFGPEARKADADGEGKSDRTTRPERVQPAPDVA